MTEAPYFTQLGYTPRYLDKDGQPSKRAIRSAVNRIADRHREAYDWFRPEVGELRFSDVLEFSESFLEMVRG